MHARPNTRQWRDKRSCTWEKHSQARSVRIVCMHRNGKAVQCTILCVQGGSRSPVKRLNGPPRVQAIGGALIRRRLLLHRRAPGRLCACSPFVCMALWQADLQAVARQVLQPDTGQLLQADTRQLCQADNSQL